jgi:hypothetical protein
MPNTHFIRPILTSFLWMSLLPRRLNFGAETYLANIRVYPFAHSTTDINE